MTVTQQRTHPGQALFARYAFPPNELGYCGPPGTGALPRGEAADLAGHAREFDGVWPYLRVIADAVGQSDPLDEQIVRSYWVGGPLLADVDALALLSTLRDAFSGQVTGLLTEVSPDGVLANHSFHVFVVYPWTRFLDRNPTTPLKVMQDCRIRWGLVDAVEDEHAVIVSRPLTFESGALGLGEPTPERVRWRRDGASLAPMPIPGQTVSAHWDWICAPLTAAEVVRPGSRDAHDAGIGQRHKAALLGVATRGLMYIMRDEGEVMSRSSEHLSKEPQEERGAPGSRDTGSDEPSGGPADRPSGSYRGDESVPEHGEAGEPGQDRRREDHGAAVGRQARGPAVRRAPDHGQARQRRR